LAQRVVLFLEGFMGGAERLGLLARVVGAGGLGLFVLHLGRRGRSQAALLPDDVDEEHNVHNEKRHEKENEYAAGASAGTCRGHGVLTP
jgi:hypothetical protein